MALSDYLGADERGRPVAVGSAPLAGLSVPMAPLTVHQVLELRELFSGPVLEPLAIRLILEQRAPTEEEKAILEDALVRAARIVFRGRPEVANAILGVLVSGGEEDLSRLEAEVRVITGWFAREHDWRRIFVEMFGVVRVVEGKIEYRRHRKSQASSDAVHLWLSESSGRHVFEMLHWRPEAYISELEAHEELLLRKAGEDPGKIRRSGAGMSEAEAFLRKEEVIH